MQKVSLIFIFSFLVGCASKASSVNDRDATGATPLMSAAGLNQLEKTQSLIKSGADVNMLDSKMGVSPLHRAAQSGNVEIIKLLLEQGAFIDDQSAVNGHTPLLDAAFYKRYAAIDFLLRNDANPELKNTLGLNVWDWAKRQKDQKILDLLSEQAKRDLAREKSLPLIQAVKNNDISALKKALNAGSDPNQTAKDGNTPLLLAARLGYTEMVDELLKRNANPNKVDKLMKATPGHKAAFFGHADVLNLLAKNKLDLNAQGPYNGYTALHDAVLNSHVEAANVLIAAGASLEVEGIDGKTPIELAKEVGVYDKLKIKK